MAKPRGHDVRTPDRREGADANTDVRTPDRREGADANTDVRTPDRREGADANTDVRRPDRREGTDANIDVASLFQRLIGAANRETAGKSTMYLYESGLTFPQIIVMYALTWLGPQPISALAEQLRLSLAATSQLVDRLVSAGYVAREEDPSDRRVRIVRMRPRGVDFMDRLNDIRRRELTLAFDRLSPKLRRRLADVLREAVDSLDAPAKRQRT
jgi:DNA-binding MarR family transcriptional regulator